MLLLMALCLCLIPSAMASSTEEQQTNLTKDTAQLKMEALEAELGEEGMKKDADYLDLQTSLPDVVKASPYSYIAFAATDKESQVVYLTAIDESDLAKEDKEKLKADLQDIWNRYPDKVVVADNLVLSDVNKIMEKRFIASANPYIYRYYNHYWDAYWDIGGAPCSFTYYCTKETLTQLKVN